MRLRSPHSFDFDPDQYDVWPIYEAIQSYYPIGIDPEQPGAYHGYAGQKELQKLMQEASQADSVYVEKWYPAAEAWGRQQGVSHRANYDFYTSFPCCSSSYSLETIEVDRWTLSRELHVAISLLGPFYTVYGTENSMLIIPSPKPRYYTRTNRVVIAPTEGYSELFHPLCEWVQAHFKGYRFVPYRIHAAQLDGLSVVNGDGADTRVYHALFNTRFPFDAHTSLKISEWLTYGMEAWQKGANS